MAYMILKMYIFYISRVDRNEQDEPFIFICKACKKHIQQLLFEWLNQNISVFAKISSFLAQTFILTFIEALYN